MSETAGFTFVDLFAGIGGFHAALEGLGGRCVYAAEADAAAQAVYRKTWLDPLAASEKFVLSSDINDDAPRLPEGASDEDGGHDVTVPAHDVLAAGFPCQAFSKSGQQQGVLDATRGTLFYNVLRIVKARRPKVVFLENVRNLVGPRHRESTFVTIVESLRRFGYTVSSTPTIISPHRIHPDLGGTPQVRDRVYILAIRSDLVDADQSTDFPGFDYGTWDPKRWRIDQTPLALYGGRTAIAAPGELRDPAAYRLADGSPERIWLDTYEALLKAVIKKRDLRRGDGVRRLPGFPLWFRHQALADPAYEQELADAVANGYDWKVEFLEKNRRFFGEFHDLISTTVGRSVRTFPESRTKLEWQAGDADSIWDCLIQLRPSGIRVKPLTYAPALVAINQAPIYGPERRRLAPLEAARLQGFPERVIQVLEGQPDKHSYKQLGNAVHVGAVQLALAQFITHHAPMLSRAGERDRSLDALRSAAVQHLAPRAETARAATLETHGAVRRRVA